MIFKSSLFASIMLFGFQLSNAAIITTSSMPPTAGFFTDAFNTAAEVSNFRVNNNAGQGQSFVTNAGGAPAYLLETITVLGSNDPINSTTESTAGLELRVYDGSGFGGTLLGTSTFTGTFNALDQYITFDLTPAETAAIGPLTSGSTYTFGLFDATAGATDFRIRRTNNSNPYAGGEALFNGAFRPGEELIFFVGGTPIPEPSGMIGILIFGIAAIFRRKQRRAI